MQGGSSHLAKIRQMCLNQTRTLIQQQSGASAAHVAATQRFCMLLFENPALGKQITNAVVQSGLLDLMEDPEPADVHTHHQQRVSLNNTHSKRGSKHLLRDASLSFAGTVQYVEGSAADAPPQALFRRMLDIVARALAFCRRKVVQWIASWPDVVGVLGVMIICCLVGNVDPVQALKVSLRELAVYLGFAPEQMHADVSDAAYPSLSLDFPSFALPRGFSLGLAGSSLVSV